MLYNMAKTYNVQNMIIYDLTSYIAVNFKCFVPCLHSSLYSMLYSKPLKLFTMK